jgi:capsular exopolysaccharide synthesis family protein
MDFSTREYDRKRGFDPNDSGLNRRFDDSEQRDLLRFRQMAEDASVGMSVDGFDIKDMLAIGWKRKWLFMAVVLVMTGLAVYYAETAQRIYRSVSVLEVTKENQGGIKNIGDALESAFTNPSACETECRILERRFLAEDLTERLDLGALEEFSGAKSPQAPSAGPTAMNSDLIDSVTRDRNSLVNEIMSRVSVNRLNDSRLIQVAMTAQDPYVAQDLLANYLDIYLERNLQKRRQTLLDAQKWLKAELARVENRLTKSLVALVDFNSKHGIVSLDDDSNHVMTFFNKAAEGLAQSEEARVRLKAYSGSVDPSTTSTLPQGVNSPELEALQTKLSGLESEAAQMRNIYSDDYPKLVMVNKQIAFIKKRIERLKTEALHTALESADQEVNLQQEAFEKAKERAMSVNSLGVQHAILKKEVTTNDQIYKIILEKSKEMDLNTQIVGNNVKIIDPPTLPVSPVYPRKKVIMGSGALLGLFLAILGVLVAEHFDNKVRTVEDIENKLKLTSLGVVPDYRRMKGPGPDLKSGKPLEFVVYDQPKLPFSEAIRNVKTGILLSTPPAESKTIVITSSTPQEGKTFLSVAIATAMSSGDRKTLLIDADMRKPRMGQVFGERSGGVGLSSLLTDGNVKPGNAIRKSRIPGLHYLPAGPTPPNPSMLLEARRMSSLMERVREFFDVVIVDTPPLLGFSDAQILAQEADGVVVVVRQGEIPIDGLREVKSLVHLTKGKILGVVLNMASKSGSSYGYYGRGGYYSRGYYGYYSSDDSAGNKSSRSGLITRLNGKGRKSA